MKKLTLILLLALGVMAVRAEIDSAKRREIEKMMRLTGMEKMVDQLMSQMITTFRTSYPDVPESFWDKFKSKMNSRDLIEKLIPLYDKYYTTEDLKAVNTFYETPAGRKIISTLPRLMSEAMEVGKEWGAQVGREVAAEIKAERGK